MPPSAPNDKIASDWRRLRAIWIFAAADALFVAGLVAWAHFAG
ncbi:MAG: hypothetical protein U5Q44_04640 [Dehalococcoidia bacterium]|nr:hypothetical protein [Dehalococcoidia bacterium]